MLLSQRYTTVGGEIEGMALVVLKSGVGVGLPIFLPKEGGGERGGGAASPYLLPPSGIAPWLRLPL
jgi:hypothetical protein